MKNLQRLWRSLLFMTLLAALCGSAAFPFVNLSANAAPLLQTGSFDLALTMTVLNNNLTPLRGDPVVFTITISNTSATEVASGVTVQDVLPSGLTYISDSGAGTYDPTTGIWIVGSIGVSSSVSLNITTNATTTGSKTNTAQLLTSNPPDTNPANNSPFVVITPKSADLSLSMVVNNPTPSVGDIVTITIAVSNAAVCDPVSTPPVACDTATGVRVRYLLPTGLTYISHSSGTYNSNTGLWSLASVSIAKGTQRTITVTASVATTGTLNNVAEVIEAEQLDPDSVPGNGATTEDDYASIQLNAPSADLSLTMSADITAPNKADNTVFTITVSNNSTTSATGVTVKDLLPAGLTYVSDDGAGTYNKNTGIWSIGSLLSNSSRTLKITAKAATTGAKTNVAEVWTSNQGDPDSTPGNGVAGEDDYASIVITPNAADLSVTITADNSNPGTGSTVVFTITISNAGPNDATGVKLKDALPAGYTYQSHSGPGSYDSGTGIWDVGSVTRNGTASLTLTTVATADPAKTNRVEILASEQLDTDSTPGNSSNNEDDDDAAPKVDLILTKSVNPASTSSGSNVVFTITVKNDGPAIATGVVVRDQLTTAFSFVSSSAGTAYNSSTGAWTVGTIPVGTTVSMTITAKATTVGAQSNYAEVSSVDQFDFNSIPGNNSTNEDDDASVSISVSYPSMTLLINEVAWAGTAASVNDEWIELHNPGTTPINLNGWTLKALDGTPNISLSAFMLQPGDYYLLERTDETTVSDITSNQIFTGDIGNSGETLQLIDPLGLIVDTANSNGGNWPAGSSSTFGTMERRGAVVDSDTAWITNTGVVAWGFDAGIPNDCIANPPCITAPKRLNGTPKHANWAISVTPTPSPVGAATSTPFRTPTPLPAPPPPLLVINEFVPRPGHDWNNDGTVNVKDEYIEILNHGTIDVNLSGYSLDDEVNIGSDPYRLPSVTLKPGERIVFYGSETGLLLGDGGDGVRLLKPNGQLMDAYNYIGAEYPDQAFCRLPDNGGADDWNQHCFPTPGLQNSLSGGANPTIGNTADEAQCPIADTLPNDFVFAECPGFGYGIWSAEFWDEAGWLDEQILPEIDSKKPVFAD